MQENGRRLLSFLLAVVMIVSMMPMSAFAQEQETAAQPSVETLQPEETLPQTAEPEEMQSKPATKNETGEEYAALEFGVPMDVEYIGPYATWITFTPEEDGIYSFTLMSQEVVGCQIYDWNKEYIKNNYGQNGLYMFQQMEGGKTYYLSVDFPYVDTGIANVTVGLSPLKSITFEPLTVVEGTMGSPREEYNGESFDYWHYYFLAHIMKYTAEFADGTKVEGDGGRLHYNGMEYEIRTNTDQSYENQWVGGNTYCVTVDAMGHEMEVPVTIEKSTVTQLVIDPITVVAGSCGYMQEEWDEQTQTDVTYFLYSVYDILQYAQTTLHYEDGSTESNVGGLVPYKDGWYSIEGIAAQSYENQWTAGNTYTMEAFVLGQRTQVQVSIIDSPVQNVVFQPVTITENTFGSLTTDEYGREYFRYYPWDLFYQSSYTIEFVDGSSYSGCVSDFYYNGNWYSMACDAPQSYDNRWTAGNTYYVDVEVMGKVFQLPVTIEASPLQKMEFQPIVLMEGETGGVATGHNGNTGELNVYFQYGTWDLFSRSSYTLTFADGTVISGNEESFTYQGQEYSFDFSTNQSYDYQWVGGNTYYLVVEVMGQTVDVPVTIVDVPVASVSVAPITIMEGTCGYEDTSYNPDTDEHDLKYYHYALGNILEKAEYTITYDYGGEVYGSGSGAYYNGQWYSFYSSSQQDYFNQWTAGNTYYFDTFLFGKHARVPVTIIEKVKPNISFQPITITEGSSGYVSSDYNPETGEYDLTYYRYNAWDLFCKTSYTITFADGYEVSGNEDGFYYNGDWYSFSCSVDQSYNNQWTAGNTYYLDVEIMGEKVQVPVTITPSPLQSVEIEPVTVYEGTCGTLVADGGDPAYYYYYLTDVLGNTTYTATFADGTTQVRNGNEGLSYNGTWYTMDLSSNQTSRNPWTVGNTYYIDVFFLGKQAQVPVTILPTPVVSVTVEAPVIVYENAGGEWNSYWPGDGNEYQYFTYHWWNKLDYKVTFSDGTSCTAFDGNGFPYNGQYYYISTADSQGYEDQWTVGNTYTATISAMGVSTQVTIIVEPSPVESVTFDPITLEEYTGGYYTWGEYGEYYHYSWYDSIRYTVTFRDGTVKTGTRWSDVEYDGAYYGITTYEDPQNGENPWLLNNTYAVPVQFEGKWHEVYVTIAKTVEVNGFTYIAQGDKAIINGCTMQGEILQIPETIDGYQVVGITSLGEALYFAEEIRIPDSVTMLSGEVFQPYTNMIPLKKLVLGKGITTMTPDMLQSAKCLEQIVVAAGNPSLCSVDGVLYNKELTKLMAYPAAKQELHKIPDSVTNVHALFAGNAHTNINVQFGDGVKDYKQVGGVIYTADMTVVMKATAAATGSYMMPETVEQIADHAFTGSNLTSVVVSPKVTQLSYRYFYEAINLEEITVPSSVREIWGSFATCEKLSKVHISDLSAWTITEGGGCLLTVAHDLYLNGEKIVDLVLPETVTEGIYIDNYIASYAFAGGSFESVTIPSRISYVGYHAFSECENLNRVNITDLSAWCDIVFESATANPLYHGRNLYLNGEKITDLVIPKYVIDEVYNLGYSYGIGSYAFYNADLKSITVPSYVYEIGTYAFAGSSVEQIILEEGVSKICYAAFENCGVKSLTLPDSLGYMEYNAFANCTALEQLEIGGGLITIASNAFSNSGLKSVTIPKQIQYVGGHAFANSQLTEVTFLCDEVQIGWSAFKNCPLDELKLGDNITYIEDEAFNGIVATQIRHPASVTEISYRVYALNPNLVSVTIPDTVQYINSAAFDGDSNLSHVLYTGTAEQWEKLEVYSAELNKATLHCEANGDEVTTEQNCTSIFLYCSICDEQLTIQKKNTSHNYVDGVCSVCGYEGFWEYEEVDGGAKLTEYLGTDTDVVIPEEIDGVKVVTFDEGVFAYNRKITSVTLPDSITQIPEGAFRSCTALKCVTLGNGVTAIGNEAFCEARSLQKINLTNNLVSVGDAAFFDCVDLEITIPESVRTIGPMAFYRCCQLVKVEIPAGVTEISYEAFAACWNLEEVIIPDTVTTIGYYAFSGAWIQEVTIPANVQEICANAFCMNPLTTVIFEGDMPKLSPIAFEQSGINIFYAASNKTWQDVEKYNNNWVACKVPTITKQPVNQTVQPGETVTLSAEAYGQRLRYQWYYAAPNTKTFTPVGGDRIELTLTVDQETSGARAYCLVTDLLGQTAKTDTVTVKNPTKATGIRLNRLPYTLEYDLRQELRTRGLEVVLIFNDNTQEQVLDYTVSGYDPNVGGVQTVMVTYGSYTATFQVTVNEEKLNFVNTEQKIELSAPEGAVEQDVELVVETVYPEQAMPELPEIPEVLQENTAVIFDITLEKGGETVQPTETVQVSIPVPEHMESKRCKVYHIGDDGVATDMNATYRDGRMVFNTDHFSYYAVVETPGVTISGTVSGSGSMVGTVVRLITGDEVLESVAVSQNGTYLFENVAANQYVIEVVREGAATTAVSVTVADEDVRKDIVFYYVAVGQARYGTLAEALENAPAGSTMQLLGSLAEAVTVTKELTLDLNGFDLTGEIAVDGGKLLIKDSQTDDYTVMDAAGYGKLTGTVSGVQAADGYMMITEETGVSFHRIDLTMTDMTLRPSQAGVYYKSSFAGDELVAQKVVRYGVALSVQGDPAEDAAAILSWFEGFEAGSNAANGTLLHGILKQTNSQAENAYNAQLPVYGRAYILTSDGAYIFGECVSRSLRQQIEQIDGMWDELTETQQTGLVELYTQYQSVMESWNISNIKSNAAK